MARALRRNWIAAALVAACAAAPTAKSTTSPTRLERALLDALESDDAEIRQQARAAFENLGTSDHVAAIARGLERDDAAERAAALRTLGLIADMDPRARPAVAPLVQRGLYDPAPECVLEAITAFSSADPSDWSELEAFLASNAWEQRLRALRMLLYRGRPVHPNDLAAALRDFRDTGFARQLRLVFEHMDDPAQRPLLEPFLDDGDPELRHRAREAAARLDAVAAGASDPRPPSQVARERYDAENLAAAAKLAALSWSELPRAELIDAVRDARLVLFAEMHLDEGPLRDAQREVLRAMAGARPDLLVLGYEPSVASAQHLVIELAAELGVATFSLETDWRELHGAMRYAERDDEAALAINDCLAERPDRRMLVVRGESHCMPGGYLCRRLAVQPVVVLSVQCPPLRALGDRPEIVNRTFRVDDDARLFFWGTLDVVQPELRDWVAARLR